MTASLRHGEAAAPAGPCRRRSRARSAPRASCASRDGTRCCRAAGSPYWDCCARCGRGARPGVRAPAGSFRAAWRRACVPSRRCAGVSQLSRGARRSKNVQSYSTYTEHTRHTVVPPGPTSHLVRRARAHPTPASSRRRTYWGATYHHQLQSQTVCRTVSCVGSEASFPRRRCAARSCRPAASACDAGRRAAACPRWVV